MVKVDIQNLKRSWTEIPILPPCFLTCMFDADNIVLRMTYSLSNPTTDDDVRVVLDNSIQGQVLIDSRNQTQIHLNFFLSKKKKAHLFFYIITSSQLPLHLSIQ